MSRRVRVSVRVGLFLGLALLVTAHLAGTVHASTFAGSHLTIDEVQVHTGHGPHPDPGHEHKADGHIDHAADRPRDVGDGTSIAPGHDELSSAPSTAAEAGAAHAARPRPSDVSLPDGRSTLALHCVWRQ
jgi:hypothetical protein